MTGYKNTDEFRAQGGSGTFKLTDDFCDPDGRNVRDITFTPSDLRLPDMGICRVYSNRQDAGRILTALQTV